MGLAVDTSGNVYISDNGSAVVRELTTFNGNIVTLRAMEPVDFSGDDCSAVNAELGSPYGLAIDSSVDLYISDIGIIAFRQVLHQ